MGDSAIGGVIATVAQKETPPARSGPRGVPIVREGWFSASEVCLEGHLHRHLNQPRGAESCELAECRTAGDVGPAGLPVAVVQDVKEVGTELRLEPLGDPEIPAQGYVEIDLARSIDGVASEIAEYA